ncbi:BaiN/RdsA family NAD(P)/FAD-dependent oxidoreductase [Fulvivirga lutea]|uniref:NAD(P)/FAD-dependent oxidoreductase n=1 Tax=Fulvivirga lutea TaxID=2810512 RepID=A0A974WHX5_9BACT|nr:NAD(P)/FAD-dependent oxidoreductase [Fulvivirga lutea]QSE96425.1 NAD(P)/FAD-dependent oxidoreductase [Fulvivirga lutea]
MEVAIIGGGAAGFFAALSVKQHYSDANVTIFEKSSKLLAKVKVSGGGRCNVTHDCRQISQLAKHYPRGEKFLKKAFSQFAVNDTIDWFENRGVRLKTEGDGRMFPVTDDSQTIIDCLLNEARRLRVSIIKNRPILKLVPNNSSIELVFEDEELSFNKVIICSGGSPKLSGMDWLVEMGIEVETPVPSLFTFNMPNEAIKSLMGLAVPKVSVKVQGTKLKQEGPLLITHWGMSGPAILKTSAWGARILADLNYDFKIQVNWLNENSEAELRSQVDAIKNDSPKKKMLNRAIEGIPSRLWEFLLKKIDLREDITWGELGSKGLNRLINILLNDVYEVKGKTTFKEEFVTCGGVALSGIDVKTMQSKEVPNLYFAGEVMNIDGVTGGFNFQAAWTTGFIAGKLTN